MAYVLSGKMMARRRVEPVETHLAWVQWTLGILRVFQAVFYASAYFRSDGVPPSAPAPLTQAVERILPLNGFVLTYTFFRLIRAANANR